MHEAMPPPAVYYRVFAALIGLLLLTIGASYLPLGVLGIAVALGIAGGKALLILLYFMHIKSGPRRAIVFAAAGFLWLAILIVLSLTDYLTRNTPNYPSPKGEPRLLQVRQMTAPDVQLQPSHGRE